MDLFDDFYSTQEKLLNESNVDSSNVTLLHKSLNIYVGDELALQNEIFNLRQEVDHYEFIYKAKYDYHNQFHSAKHEGEKRILSNTLFYKILYLKFDLDFLWDKSRLNNKMIRLIEKGIDNYERNNTI